MPDEQQASAAKPDGPEDETVVDAALETAPEQTSEPVPAPFSPTGLPAPDPGYNSSGVPTFDSVREKIETRYGTAIGAVELAEETPEGRSVAEQYEARERAAAERLQQIRKSMSKDES